MTTETVETASRQNVTIISLRIHTRYSRRSTDSNRAFPAVDSFPAVEHSAPAERHVGTVTDCLPGNV